MQASNIVLADAQATPVNHTFIPIGRDANGVFWFEDQSASSSIGFWRVSVETKRAPISGGTASGTYRTKIGLHQPVLETLGTNQAGLTPPPTVAYVSRAIVEFIDPARSLQQNRADASKMFPLLLQNSLVQDILKTHQELSF